MKAMIQSKLFKLTLKKSIQTVSNSPDKKESNNGIEHVGMQKGANFTIVYTSDWLKQQKLRKLHKAVYIFILNFPTNFHITKSRLGLNNTEIPSAEHLKL